jgi:hypothetical protein
MMRRSNNKSIDMQSNHKSIGRISYFGPRSNVYDQEMSLKNYRWLNSSTAIPTGAFKLGIIE